MWLYGSGFPKSMDIGLAFDKKNGIESKTVETKKQTSANEQFDNNRVQNEWKGWGTCLKPAYEPIIVARKPFKGTLVNNVIKNGVGGLNIDECRIPFEKTQNPATNPLYRKLAGYKLPEKGQLSNGAVKFTSSKNDVNRLGRFPANIILTYNENDYNEVCSGFPNGKKNGSITKRYDINNLVYGNYGKCNTFNAYNDEGSASRYFYCAKASSKDREEGLEDFEAKSNKITNMYDMPREDGTIRKVPTKKNIHPTVKPTELMQYLIRLVTPKGGTICDPFMGSGSTGKAVMYENKERNANYKFIGIEITDEYLPISVSRINYVKNNVQKKGEKNEQTLS